VGGCVRVLAWYNVLVTEVNRHRQVSGLRYLSFDAGGVGWPRLTFSPEVSHGMERRNSDLQGG